MFCVQCGQGLPEIARFCLRCGSPVSILSPTDAAAAVQEQVPLQQTTKPATRPYRWGMFQGWCLILLPPIAALTALATSTTDNEYAVAVDWGLWSVISVPMGIGIIKKRRYGLILVYVSLALLCLSIVIALLTGSPDAAIEAASGAFVWVWCTIYYHKRRDEFGLPEPQPQPIKPTETKDNPLDHYWG